jgi:hypothetical protein
MVEHGSASPRVLILGGSGLAGGFIASALLASPGVSVLLGARGAGALKRAAAELAAKHDPERITTTIVDASEPASLARAMDGMSIVVLATHAKTYRHAVAQAAIEAGVDVIDLMSASLLLEPLRSRAEDAGRCIVTDAGLSPGLPSVLMRLGGSRLDRMRTAFVGGAVSNPKGWPAETLEEVVDELGAVEPLLCRDGEWRRRPVFGALDARSFDLGPERGKRRCSLFFSEELRDIPAMFPSLQDAGGYLSVNWFVDRVALPAAVVLVKVAPERGRRPASRFIGWGMRRFARPPFGAVLVLDATGESDGSPTMVRVVVTHRSEYEATGEVVATYVSHWTDPASGARRPGIHIMGHIVEPESFLWDLAGRGFDID